MGQRIHINNKNMAVLLYSNQQQDWLDRAMSISAMYESFYYESFTGYDIYFRGGSKKFFYRHENVQILKKVKSVSIEKYDVYADGVIVNASALDKFEKGYYRVHFGRGTLFTKEIKLKSNAYKDIFQYYAKLADYAGQIAEEKSPLYYLSQNYKRITPSRESVLYGYLQGEFKSFKDGLPVLVPFDSNQSQVRAIEKALTNSISIIEGPPGTGKTQTILNLIANLVYRGKNLAVISNNNSAIENVRDKLDEENLSFLAAFLGRYSNVIEFFESDQNEELAKLLKNIEVRDGQVDRKRIAELSVEMKQIQDTEVEIAALESELDEVQNESGHLGQVSESLRILKSGLSSSDYISLITRLEKPKRMWFFEKLRLGIKFRVRIGKHDLGVLLQNAETLYYFSKVSELTSKLDSRKKILGRLSKASVAKEIKSLSRSLLDQAIKLHYAKYGLREFSKDSYKQNYADFLRRYPVVLSTSQSLLNNAPRGFTFDYLIIDEASQGDLLSNVLAMSCAKNVVVVGDSRQLQQIEEERLFPESIKLSAQYGVSVPYRYESNSILKSVRNAVTDVPVTLLKEHYRCAPDIINFCNKMFYEGELVPMTRNSGRHINIIKTVPGNHARSNPRGSGLYNQREIDEIGFILGETSSESIGIISPFRYQADLISDFYNSDRIEADTIHKFQGRQKEEVILSFVVNSLENHPENGESRLNDFVTNAKLLNVAISRGRNKVTAIVSDKVYQSSNNTIHDFIKYAEYLYGHKTTRESRVTSVFDLLYSEYTKTLIAQFKERPKGHRTELLMCDIIDLVLKDYSYIGYSMHTRLGKLVSVPDTFTEEEKRYILHPWTHVDFLFYNKVSKERLFVLEVDGIRYHEQNRKQAEHDDIKNRVLQSNHIPVYRFRTNESEERRRLTEILTGYLH